MPLVRRRDDLTFSFVHSIDNLHQPLDLKIGVDDFVDLIEEEAWTIPVAGSGLSLRCRDRRKLDRGTLVVLIASLPCKMLVQHPRYGHPPDCWLRITPFPLLRSPGKKGLPVQG